MKSTTATSLVVDLAVAANATAGNNTLTVHSSGSPPQTATTTFFVQVPTKLSVLSIAVLPTGTSGDYGCQPTIPNTGILSDYGIMIDIKYQVLDQQTQPQPQPIMSTGMIPHEHIVHADGTSSDGNIGPSRISTTSLTTDSSGAFHDAPVGVCGTDTFSVSISQDISLIVGNASFTIRHNPFSISSTGLGHGSITNGSDVSAMR